MTYVVLTFIGVVALIVGIYWAMFLRPEEAARESLQKRMRPEDPARKSRLAVPKSELRDPHGPFQGLQYTIDQSGMKLTVTSLLFVCGLAAVVVAVIVWTIVPQQILALGAGLLASLVPYAFVRHAATSRMWKFEEQFPEAIELIARALRAGHAFPTGLSMVADEIGPPVGPEFKLLYDRQNYGMALPDALRAFARRVPVLDARFFVTAVLTQREAGGNLSGVLDNLASVIRERFKVKRQVRVISAHGRITAAVLSLLPPCVAAAQAVISPGMIGLLIKDPLGVNMLMLAAGLQITGMFVISRIVKVEY